VRITTVLHIIIILITQKTQSEVLQKPFASRCCLIVSCGQMELSTRNNCDCLYCWLVQGLHRTVQGCRQYEL